MEQLAKIEKHLESLTFLFSMSFSLANRSKKRFWHRCLEKLGVDADAVDAEAHRLSVDRAFADFPQKAPVGFYVCSNSKSERIFLTSNLFLILSNFSNTIF